MDAPEKIWARPFANYYTLEHPGYGVPATEYTRSDLVAELAATEAMATLVTLVRFYHGGKVNRQPWARVLAKCEAAIKAAMDAGLVSDPNRDHNP